MIKKGETMSDFQRCELANLLSSTSGIQLCEEDERWLKYRYYWVEVGVFDDKRAAVIDRKTGKATGSLGVPLTDRELVKLDTSLLELVHDKVTKIEKLMENG